jgi:hypothetical protein
MSKIIQLKFYHLVLRLLQMIVLKLYNSDITINKEAVEQSFDLADDIKKELKKETNP